MCGMSQVYMQFFSYANFKKSSTNIRLLIDKIRVYMV